ncbi:amidohydrolase family protein [candidate division KSB1 bacterium]|nr:amidohydrolase family protein [candidate division KSB1 bacterium]
MIFDLNVFLGYWPFRRLRHSGSKNVLKLMDRTNTDKALALPLQAVFYKDCLEGVQEMLNDIGSDRNRLLPLAVVNPNFPGWERDLRDTIENLGCVGCGILPNYHGYRVYDSCCEALLKTLIELDLPALLFIRLWDERSHHWCMRVPPIDIQDIEYVLNTFPALRIAIGNANLPSEGVSLVPFMKDRTQTLLLTSYKSLYLARMIEQIGAAHLAYGSGTPMYYAEAALMQILEADIDESARSRILYENAASFISQKGIK